MADTTYPAVELSRIVRNDQAKYYGHESGHARGRVNLRKDSDPENKCVPVRTTIVQRYGRCPRMTLHSKSRVVTNSQLRRGGGPSYHRYNMSDRERGGGGGLGRLTNKDQPWHARTSWLPLSKGGINGLLEFTCLAIKEYAQRTCALRVES